MKNRSPYVKNLNEVESISSDHGSRFASSRKRLAAATQGKEIGCSWYEIPEGKQGFPHHHHYGNEEVFFILSGTGELRLGEHTHSISAGDYITCLPLPECAHSIKNTGNQPLTYLAFSTSHSTDIIVYPDSKKFFVCGGADMHKGLKTAEFSKMLKDQESVDYYWGEE